MLETQVHLGQLEIELQKVIDSHTDFNLKGLQPQAFIEIETLLFLMINVFPEEPITSIWVILNRYEFNIPQLNSLSEEHKRWVGKAAYAFPLYRGAKVVGDRIRLYREVTRELRLYEVDDNNQTFHRKGSPSLPKREAIYREFFNDNFPVKTTRGYSFATPGTYYFYEDDKQQKEIRSVNITQAAYNQLLKYMGVNRDIAELTSEGIIKQNSNILNILKRNLRVPLYELSGTKRNSGTIEFPKNGLIETARFMDSQLDSPKYESVISNMRWENLDPNKDNNILYLEGTKNLQGIVNAGKSILSKIIAVHGAKQGKRTTLVLTDVLGVLETVDELSKILRNTNIKVAPILGLSNRKTHTARLHFSLRHSQQPYQHEGLRNLSTVCLLDSLQDGTLPTIDASIAPCSGKLYSQKDSQKDSQNQEDKSHTSTRYNCPFYYVCPAHQASRDLIEAEIWVTTLQALFYTRVPQQLLPNNESIKYGELVNLASEIVIIDESDKCQPLSDETFSPAITILGKGAEPLINYLNRLVADKNEQTNLGHLYESIVESWQSAKEIVVSLFTLAWPLLKNDFIENWIDRGYFTTSLLLNQIADILTPKNIREERENPRHIYQIFLAYQNDPLDTTISTLENNYNELAIDLRRISNELRNKARALQKIKTWIINCQIISGNQLSNLDLEQLPEKLYFALILEEASRRLFFIVEYLPIVQHIFNIEDSSISFKPPKDFEYCLPTSPLGNRLAFSYVKSSKDREPGRLDLIRYSGVGRWFLLNFHRLFEWNGIQGPRVLLMSATSWAGNSSTFHLQIPVDIMIKPSLENLERITTESKYKFSPLKDGESVLRISGSQNKAEALGKMARYLCARESDGKNFLERVRDEIQDPLRRRLLLLVGSYRDAQLLQSLIRQNYPTCDEDEVFALQADLKDIDALGEEVSGGIQRGDVAQFAKAESAWILIAPMMAIERGHNILNLDRVAAFGAALFLVRPFPVPDNPELLVQMLNHWTLEKLGDSLRDPSRKRNFFESLESNPDQPPTLGDYGNYFLTRARKYYNWVSNLKLTYSQLPKNIRSDITWSLRVLINQVSGRLIRGGVGANIYFVDGAFAPESAFSRSDTSSTSLLVSILEEIDRFKGNQVADNLYGSFNQPMLDMVGDTIFVNPPEKFNHNSTAK